MKIKTHLILFNSSKINIYLTISTFFQIRVAGENDFYNNHQPFLTHLLASKGRFLNFGWKNRLLSFVLSLYRNKMKEKVFVDI